MDKESIIYDTATISDIPELVRLRILYMTDDFGSLTNEEREGMEKQLPGYFERELGKKLIAFVARAEGRLVAAAYLLIIEKPANPFIERPVRDLHSEKRVPPLFCKVIVDGDKVTLESKGKDNKKQTISWRDMVYQVETAIEDASMKPSK